MRVFSPFFLLLILDVIFIHHVYAQKPDLKFNHIDSFDGLSHGSVSCVIQDYLGFMWFGTLDGLNRYDGYDIMVYQKSSDSTSLPSSDILSLLEDSEKNLWVGTNEGVSRYDRDRDLFIRYPEVGDGGVQGIFEDNNHDVWLITGPHLFFWNKEERAFIQQNETSVGMNIVDFFQDRHGTYWVGLSNGIFIYDKEKRTYVSQRTDVRKTEAEPTIPLHGVLDILEDRNGNFWIAVLGGGLVLYDREQGQIVRKYQHEPNNPNSLIGDALMTLEMDADGRIWIGTQNQGLSIFDPEKEEFYNYRSNNLDLYSLSFNTINTIYKDDNGNMWLATHNKGMNFVRKRKFSHFYTNSLNHTGLSDNNVTSFVEDQHGDIWVGTDGGGLSILDRKQGEFRQLRHDPTNPQSPGANVVTYILQDAKDGLWFAYWAGGLDRFDPERQTWTRYRHHENDTTSILQDHVMYLYEDKMENLWVATLTGLDLFDAAAQTFEHVSLGTGLDNYVVSMTDDRDGNLWVGTWNGLKLLNRNTRRIEKEFIHDPESDQSLSDDKIYVVFADSKGRVWVGTSRGLNLLDKSTFTFTQYHESDGLPTEAIYGILEDEGGNLWLSTGNGLSRFNPEREIFKNFVRSDGLQDREFKLHAYLKLRSGEMIFGGGNGFNLFDPQSIQDNTYIPPVVLTDFKVFNKSLEIGGADAILSRSITVSKEIILSWQHSVFSIEFATLDYISPQDNQYAYILEGFDRDWVLAGNNRSATYTNLDPGTYTFRVKASNSDGYWNEEGASLSVVITPPFWQTDWFRLLGVLFITGSVFGFVQLRTYRAREIRRELEQKVEEQTRELREARNEAIAASKSKSEFLANMSHEIRTPMNGIIGMAELAMESDPNDRQREYLNMIVQSSDSLVAIINDILDYSKIEAGKLHLHETQFNLVDLMESVLASFSVKALEKDVELLCELQPDIPAFVKADSLRLRQIMTNLIGNALKFTSKGEVLVSVERENKPHADNEIPLHVQVKDTGIGIPEDKLKLIFESFSQADASTTRQYGGTGLGLAICQRLVQMMGGDIWVESQEGRGSIFHFTVRCNVAEDAERISSRLTRGGSFGGVHFLVVDDNKTNCVLLHDLLVNQGAQVTVAHSGYEGLRKLEKEPGMVVLLDHQMPKMDGLEFVEQLREGGNTRTKIILLSSIADMTIADAQQAGVDGYLTKPIRRKELWKVINETLGHAQQKPKQQQKPVQASKQVVSSKKVLLVEDNKANQIVARHMFAKFGISLEYADDGKEALDKLGETKYDIVFMDIQMPHADGYQVTREVRGAKQHVNHEVPIIAMTAYAMNGDREKCLDAGMNDYISKPIKVNDLKEKIVKWKLVEEESTENVAQK